MRGIIKPILIVISLYLILAIRIWSESFKFNLESYDQFDGSRRSSLENSSGGYDRVPGAKCSNFGERLDKLVASSKSVFITMPAKAAGTSLKKFTFACVGTYSYEDSKTKKKKSTNFINEGNDKVQPFISTVSHPKILTSHTYSDYGVIDVLKNTPRDNLNIYIYRQETDRLLSAIREVVMMSVCTNNVYPEITAERTDDKCVIDETTIVDLILKPKKAEIGFGNPQIMTCDFYKAIEDHFPRMVFVHYSKATELQRILAKYHCPDLTNESFHDNMSSDKKKDTLVRLANDNSTMPFGDWLETKRHTIQFTFDYSNGNDCQAKTMKLEDKLLACEEQILEVTGDIPFI